MSARERVAYGVAVVILVIGGAIVRTPILNWIVGPAIVIACVWLIAGNDRRRRTAGGARAGGGAGSGGGAPTGGGAGSGGGSGSDRDRTA